MKDINFFNSVFIDTYSSTPKYLQLAHSMMEAIESGKLQKDELLPSLNELTSNLEISKETADKGYKYLQDMGVLKKVPGKGHYIANSDLRQQIKICLMINKLSSEKKVFYDAFVQTLGEHASVSFYIYNSDFSLFKKQFNQNGWNYYSHYVIMPHFVDGASYAYELINTIPREKLIILDKRVKKIEGRYGCIYENFRKDIYQALEKALDRLSKYHTLKLVFPEHSYYPEEITEGFHQFCQQYAFERKVIGNVKTEVLNRGEVFICLTENDLVTLVERIRLTELEVGRDVGIISYNETPLKKYILNGITTISTDYYQMGIAAANMILGDYRDETELPFRLKLRASL